MQAGIQKSSHSLWVRVIQANSSLLKYLTDMHLCHNKFSLILVFDEASFMELNKNHKIYEIYDPRKRVLKVHYIFDPQYSHSSHRFVVSQLLIVNYKAHYKSYASYKNFIEIQTFWDTVATLHKQFSNFRELLCQDSHSWQLTMALHYSTQHGEQCFAKYGFMTEYTNS